MSASVAAGRQPPAALDFHGWGKQDPAAPRHRQYKQPVCAPRRRGWQRAASHRPVHAAPEPISRGLASAGAFRPMARGPMDPHGPRSSPTTTPHAAIFPTEAALTARAKAAPRGAAPGAASGGDGCVGRPRPQGRFGAGTCSWPGRPNRRARGCLPAGICQTFRTGRVAVAPDYRGALGQAARADGLLIAGGERKAAPPASASGVRISGRISQGVHLSQHRSTPT